MPYFLPTNSLLWHRFGCLWHTSNIVVTIHLHEHDHMDIHTHYHIPFQNVLSRESDLTSIQCGLHTHGLSSKVAKSPLVCYTTRSIPWIYTHVSYLPTDVWPGLFWGSVPKYRVWVSQSIYSGDTWLQIGQVDYLMCWACWAGSWSSPYPCESSMWFIPVSVQQEDVAPVTIEGFKSVIDSLWIKMVAVNLITIWSFD